MENVRHPNAIPCEYCTWTGNARDDAYEDGELVGGDEEDTDRMWSGPRSTGGEGESPDGSGLVGWYSCSNYAPGELE